MSDGNSNISGTQSGGFATKDKVLNQTIGMESSIKSGADKAKSGGGNLLHEYNNMVMEASQKTGNWFSDFFTNFSKGLSFENGVEDVIYDI
ncbi:MAG: hypothetical protein COA45_11785 [Zetaproteobacteria bacterium]|nr:MAG: hypothetical protein COA45_11785 [Zetaproteobacteria bacterium]